jgi:hemoglobin/transferrin/lactoferrin receptor protein
MPNMLLNIFQSIRYWTLLFSIIGLISNLQAQTLQLKDEITHEPIVMATIFCVHGQLATTSDLKGEAEISAFAGCDSIFIQYIGYSTHIFNYEELKQKQFIVYLEQSSISLDEMVVSATRWQQKKRDVANKITSIRAQDVVIQNPQTTADLLGQTGEVFIQKSQLGGGSPMIRGFATNRVLLSVDGIRMNNAIFRSGNLQNIISLDAFSIQKTEVVFGPGSVIYGSDAIGGVMSFNTIKPEVSGDGSTWLKGHGAARYASANNEKTGHFDVNIGFQKWALVTSVSYSDFGDLLMGKHGPDDYLRPEWVVRQNGQDVIVPNSNSRLQSPSAYQQVNILQKVHFKPNERWKFQYDFHYSTTGDYPRYDRLIRYKNEQLRSAEWYYGPQVWMMNHFHAHHQANHNLYNQIVIRAAHQYFKESRHDRDLNSPTRSNRTEEVNAWSINVDFEKSIHEHQLSYGTEFIANGIGSSAFLQNIEDLSQAPTSTRYPDGSNWYSLGIYADYRHKLTPQLNLQLGARYNHILLNATFDNLHFPLPFDQAKINPGALTGSAGLVYNPDESLQLMANLASGFRAPNIDDVGKIFDSEPGAVVVPNANLKSEYSVNMEVGLAKVFHQKVKFDFSAYYTWLHDAMVRRDYQLNGQDSILYDGTLSRVQAIQNAARAYVYGLQAGIECKFPLGFGFSSRFNMMKGREELDNGDYAPLRHATPWFGLSHLTYSRNRIKADFYLNYSGQVSYDQLPPSEQSKDDMYALDENGHPYSPAWLTFNLKTLLRLTDQVLLTAGIENITNQRYRPYASGLSAAGRNVIVGLKASF